MKTSPVSIRVVIPLALLLFSGMLALSLGSVGYHREQRLLVQAARERSQSIALIVSSELETRLRQDAAGTEQLLRQIANDRSVRGAALFDAQATVMWSLNHAETGEPVARTRFADVAPLVGAAARTRQPQERWQPEQERLVLLFPLHLSPRIDQDNPGEIGVVAVEHDLGRSLSLVRSELVAQGARWMLAALAGCALLVGLFNLLLVRPTRHLVAATARIGAGDLRTPEPLVGGDELAQLSGAIAEMVRGLREAQQDSAEAAERLSEVLENSSDLIATLTPEGTICLVSGSVTRLLARDAEALIGTSLLDWLPPAQQPALLAELQAPTGQPLSVTVQAPAGARVVELVCSRRGSDAPDSLIINGRDVTDRMALEEQLRQSQKLEAVGQLAGGIAHDFNNMLSIVSMSCTLLRESGQLNADALEDLQGIESAAERAAALTRRILSFSRHDAYAPQVLLIDALLSELRRPLRRLIPANIQLRYALDAATAPVRIDPGQLEQVVLNLIINARDAMPDGGEITVRTARDGARLRVEIADTGSGIAPEDLARIFEPFFTTKPAGRGTGLGLSIVSSIVREAGGGLSLESTLGVGTTCTFYLPIAAEQPAPAPETHAPLHPRRVVLIEDDDLLRDLIISQLSGDGHAVDAAATLAEGRALVESQRPDLLISDVMLPDGAGSHLAAALLPEHPTMQVLLISGYAPDSNLQTLLQQERVAFLPKPFTPSQLRDKLYRLEQRAS